MKYHSPIRIVILSLIIVLTFSFISLSSIFLFSAKSATELIVSSAFERLAEGDDISISFSSLDRNIRGNITLNDVDLAVRGESILNIERVRLSTSFFSLIRSFFGASGVFNVDFYSPRISIGESELTYLISLLENTSTEPSQNEDEKINDFTFNLFFHSLYAEYGLFCIDNAEVFLQSSTDNPLSRLEVSLDEFNYDDDEISIKLSQIEARAINDSNFSLDGGIGDVNLEYEGYGIDAKDMALSIILSDLKKPTSEDLTLRLSLSSLDAYYEESFYSRLYPSSFSIKDGKFDANISLLVASYLNYAVSLSDLYLSYDLLNEDITMDSVRSIFYHLTDPIATFDDSVLSFSLSEKAGSIDIGSVECDYISNYQDVFSSLNLKNTGIDFDFSNDFSFTLFSNAIFESDNDLLDGMSMDIKVDGVGGETIENLDLILSEIRLKTLKYPLYLKADYNKEGTSLSLTYSRYASFKAEFGDQINIDASIDNLKVEDFKAYITQFAPFFENYISDNTLLNGIFNATLHKDEDALYGVSGSLNYAVGLSGINFATFTFNAASSLSSRLEGNVLDISSFNLTTDLVRLQYKGELNLEEILPSGHFILENTSSGKDYATLDLNLRDLGEYEFDFRIPHFEAFSLSGIFNFEDSSHLYSDANLFTSSNSYGFSVDIDFANKQIQIENALAELLFSYDDSIEAHLEFASFDLPHRDVNQTPAMLNGRLDFLFDIYSQEIRLSSEDFMIENIYTMPGSPTLTFSIEGDNNSLRLKDIEFTSLEFINLGGEAVYLYDQSSFSLSLSSAMESLMLSITPYEDYMTGLFTLENFNGARIGLEEGIVNARLSGRGADFDSLAFSGRFEIGSSSQEEYKVSSELIINSREIEVSNFIYQDDVLSITIDHAILSAELGELRLPISLTYDIVHPDRIYPVELSLDFMLTLEKEDNLYLLTKGLLEEDFSSIRGSMTLNGVNIDNTLISNRGSLDFDLRNNRLNFYGNMLNGYLDYRNKYFDINLNLVPIIRLKAEGSYLNALDIALEISDFSLYSANLFILLPVIPFTADSNANGRLNIIGTPGDIHMYGSLWSERVEFDVFWLPGEHVTAHDIYFSVWDNNIESAIASLSTVNTSTGVRADHKGRLCFYLNDDLTIDNYTVDVYVKEGNEINFRLPMQSQNIDIVGRVSGDFHLYQRGMEYIKLSGNMNIMDTQLSLGMYDLPSWMSSKITVGYDFNINLIRNNTFIFPLGANPILSATADENQFLRFYSTDDGMLGASGGIRLRAGEIYYFQRSFFIREGDITFRENDLSSIDPVINLRASLRAFDSNGQKVDIYLVLREASLTNFTPTFESSPAKDLSEIMSILGQQIVSNQDGSSNLGSVVSILTTGVDVLQRMGIVRQSDNSLQMSIRNSLNLDTFSLHTNIIGNLVYDAVLSGQSNSRWNVSPVARYLDGTALYIGKYLTSDLYFEALAHLSAQRNTADEDISSFLSSDLSLDVEISLEWENPLCSVTLFTLPRSLTIDDALRYIGLSFTKRFVF